MSCGLPTYPDCRMCQLGHHNYTNLIECYGRAHFPNNHNHPRPDGDGTSALGCLLPIIFALGFIVALALFFHNLHSPPAFAKPPSTTPFSLRSLSSTRWPLSRCHALTPNAGGITDGPDEGHGRAIRQVTTSNPAGVMIRSAGAG